MCDYHSVSDSYKKVEARLSKAIGAMLGVPKVVLRGVNFYNHGGRTLGIARYADPTEDGLQGSKGFEYKDEVIISIGRMD